jgi:hypothetical protein
MTDFTTPALPVPGVLVWRRVGPGVYDDATGRVTLYKIVGCNPPAWNVEWTIEEGNLLGALDDDGGFAALAHTNIVDGAASYRDAKALATEAWPQFREYAEALEESACERCSCGGTRVGFDAHCDRCGATS